MFGIPVLNLVTAAIYSLVMAGIDFVTMRRVRSQEDFSLGPGGLGSRLTLIATTPFHWFTSPWFQWTRVFSFGAFFYDRSNPTPTWGVLEVLSWGVTVGR